MYHEIIVRIDTTLACKDLHLLLVVVVIPGLTTKDVAIAVAQGRIVTGFLLSLFNHTVC